jgi:hypothetical protein
LSRSCGFAAPVGTIFAGTFLKVRERRGEGFFDMLIKILLLTILVGSIAVSPHIPTWANLAKRKGS